MADKATDELISYLQLRLEADGLDYHEAVTIEDLMTVLTHENEATGAKDNPANRDNT